MKYCNFFAYIIRLKEKSKKMHTSIRCVPSLQRRNRGEKSSCIKQLNGANYPSLLPSCQLFSHLFSSILLKNNKSTIPLFFLLFSPIYKKNLGPSETYIATKDKRLHTHTFIVHINPTHNHDHPTFPCRRRPY